MNIPQKIVFFEEPKDLDIILDDFREIGLTNQPYFSTETHKIYKGPKSEYIFKAYKEDEIDRPYKGLLVSRVVSSDYAMQSGLIISNEIMHCLVSKEIKREGISEPVSELELNLRQLKKFQRGSQSLKLDKQGFYDSKQSSNILLPPIFFENIDYPIELVRRAFKTRKTDKYKRFDFLPKEFYYGILKEYNLLFPKEDTETLVHGDCINNNCIGGIFLDFDHVRRGPREYDFGRLLTHRIMLPFEEIVSIARKNIDTIDDMEIWKNYLHHNFTLSAAALAGDDIDLFRNYIIKILAVSNLLGRKDINKLVSEYLIPLIR